MQFKGTGTLLVKDLDIKQGIVSAYWSAFGNVDEQKDVVDRGFFKKSILERGPKSAQPRIKFLYQHDEKMLVAKPSELIEDTVGLLATYQIPPTTLGKDILILYEYGVLTEHSIGYETLLTSWDHKLGARHLIEGILWEGSAVTWGANELTPVVAVKSLNDPSRLQEMASRAQTLDKLLHDGSLRCDDLCATFERELKALSDALAPTTSAPDRPYEIKSVLDGIDDLTNRLAQKSASADDKAAQKARSKQYHIAVKQGGNVTKPTKWADVDDDHFGDPVNYRYPMPDKAHADNAASRFAAASARAQYTKTEQGIIKRRIAARQKSFGEDGTDKGAAMNKRHAKSQQSNDGTASPTTPPATNAPATNAPATDASRDYKARDFGTLFQSLSASDQLQDEWGDTFIAFTKCMSELMWKAQAARNGWLVEGDDFDLMTAAKDNLDAFSEQLLDLVQRSDDADFCPCLDSDGDQFLDPDGVNANDDDDYKSATPTQRMTQQPATVRKSGAAISRANRDTITKALDGMSDHMKGMMEHHGALVDLMNKTDPDAVRADEDQALGVDDTNDGGKNPNKSRIPAPDRQEAGTTQQGLDYSALDADLNALKSRTLGGKAQ